MPFIAITLLAVALSSCRSAGPNNMVRDRNGYINAISDSWKNQMLLNIVKLRYADAPVFLDIASIVNSYETRGEVSAGGMWEQVGAGLMPAIGATATFSDKPTVSYSPLQGSKFAMSMMNPIGPSTVMGLIYAGYPVDMVFRLMLSSVNGISNSYSGPMRKKEASPDFYNLLQYLKKIQDANGLSVGQNNKTEGAIDFYMKDNIDTSLVRNVAEIKKIQDHENQTKNVAPSNIDCSLFRCSLSACRL